MKSHHYWKAVSAFKKDLREAIPHAELKALHVRHPHKHLLYAARQFATQTMGSCQTRSRCWKIGC